LPIEMNTLAYRGIASASHQSRSNAWPRTSRTAVQRRPGGRRKGATAQAAGHRPASPRRSLPRRRQPIAKADGDAAVRAYIAPCRAGNATSAPPDALIAHCAQGVQGREENCPLRCRGQAGSSTPRITGTSGAGFFRNSPRPVPPVESKHKGVTSTSTRTTGLTSVRRVDRSHGAARRRSAPAGSRWRIGPC
jgi:hypothetical protein